MPDSGEFDAYFVSIAGTYDSSEDIYYVAEAQFYLGVD